MKKIKVETATATGTIAIKTVIVIVGGTVTVNTVIKIVNLEAATIRMRDRGVEIDLPSVGEAAGVESPPTDDAVNVQRPRGQGVVAATRTTPIALTPWTAGTRAEAVEVLAA